MLTKALADSEAKDQVANLHDPDVDDKGEDHRPCVWPRKAVTHLDVELEVVRLRFRAELARLIKEVAREWGKLPIMPQTQRTSLRLPSPISTRRHAS